MLTAVVVAAVDEVDVVVVVDVVVAVVVVVANMFDVQEVQLSHNFVRASMFIFLETNSSP